MIDDNLSAGCNQWRRRFNFRCRAHGLDDKYGRAFKSAVKKFRNAISLERRALLGWKARLPIRAEQCSAFRIFAKLIRYRKFKRPVSASA
jgi:hypothetical protein